MTAGTLGSVSSNVGEEANPLDHVLDERLREFTDELEQAALDGSEGRGVRLDRGGREEVARLNADCPGKAGHEGCRRLKPTPLQAAHGLGGYPDGLRYVGLRKASLVSQGSKSSPDSQGFWGSGHARRVGRQGRLKKGRSHQVIRLDLARRRRDDEAGPSWPRRGDDHHAHR